jgi:hypothetical protein
MGEISLTQEMLKTFRTDWARLGNQREKLEKLQRMRQTVERLNFTRKHLSMTACRAD